MDLESRRLSSFAILCLWLRQELFAQFDVDVPRDRIPTLAAKAAIIPKFIRTPSTPLFLSNPQGTTAIEGSAVISRECLSLLRG